MSARWPRLRLASTMGASLVVSMLADPWRVSVVVGFGVLLLLARALVAAHGGALLKTMLRRLCVVNLFVAMVWLTLPWQLDAGGLVLSQAGIDLATLISLRTNAIGLICIGLLTGLDAFAIARAAAGLGLPHKLARLMALTVRYLGLLQDTRYRLERAMRARGFRPGLNRRTVVVTAQLVALLLVHAMLRAERVEMAMRARGFAPRVRPEPTGDVAAPAVASDRVEVAREGA